MENNTSAPVCPQVHDAGIGWKVGATVGLSLPMCVGFVSNLLVVIVFKKNPSTRTNTNCFIVNMASSDLLFSLFGMPFHMVQRWLGAGRFLIGGPVGEFLCKLVPFVMDISMAVSILIVVLIAVERFVAVVYPLKTVKFTSRRRTTLVIMTWVVAAALHSPYCFFFGLKTRCNRFYCEGPLDKIYFTILINILVPIPLLVIAVLYASMFLELRRMKIPGSGGSQADAQCARRRERNKKITKMSICIVLAFTICYLPAYVFFMLALFSPNPVYEDFYLVIVILAWTNGAVNPCFLFYFCGNFRSGLRNMFGCCSGCCQYSNQVVEQNMELQIIGRNPRET